MSTMPKKAVVAKVAEELNDLMGLDPPIDVKKGRNIIVEGIKKASEYLTPQDELSDSAIDVLKAVGGTVPGADDTPAPGAGDSESADNAQPADASDGGEEPSADAGDDGNTGPDEGGDGGKEASAETGGKAGKKKTSKKKAGKKAGKKASKKAPAKSGEKKYTRIDAMQEALQTGGTRTELAERMQELYEKNGCKGNPNGAKAVLDLYLPVLRHFGVVSRDNGVWELAK